MRTLVLAIAVGALCGAVLAEGRAELHVTGIKAASRNGQTFVTWLDAAEGHAGSKFRYSLYRSDKPITQDNLAQAELCYNGVLNNSAKMFGSAFYNITREEAVKAKRENVYGMSRLNPDTPVFQIMRDRKLVPTTQATFVIEEGGRPLPMWSGVAVRTILKDAKSFYAVMVTDEKYQPVGRIVPGESATAEAVEEKVAPPQPIKQFDSRELGQYAASSSISGKKGLPLSLSMHGSQSVGGGLGQAGDLYIYFATADMGWRDGLPGGFNVHENSGSLGFSTRDAIENPTGNGVIETCWLGYYCRPFGATHKEPRAYPFTERRLEWMVKWVIEKYGADVSRVYCGGQSMGGMVSTQWAFHHPELFAAVYPRLGRVRQTWMPGCPCCGLDVLTAYNKSSWKGDPPLMEDGKTDYFTYMDSVKWAREHHEDLPFYCWCFGRTDTVAPWTDNSDMVKALTDNHHGFAFAWNNAGHSSEGGAALQLAMKYYPSKKFARNQSYPAFGNSSINSKFGNGDRADGDLIGGINIGFDWADVQDTADAWSATISNELAKVDMTVDVTPRRCQQFKPKAGDKFKWTNSAGGEGEVAADQWALVTVEKVKIKPGEGTTLLILRGK